MMLLRIWRTDGLLPYTFCVCPAWKISLLRYLFEKQIVFFFIIEQIFIHEKLGLLCVCQISVPALYDIAVQMSIGQIAALEQIDLSLQIGECLLIKLKRKLTALNLSLSYLELQCFDQRTAFSILSLINSVNSAFVSIMFGCFEVIAYQIFFADEKLLNNIKLA